MTQEQGWEEANEHHDSPFAELDQDEEYPREEDTQELPRVEEAAQALTGAMREYAVEPGDALVTEQEAMELLTDPFLLGVDGSRPKVHTARRVLSSGMELRIVADGPHNAVAFSAEGVRGEQAVQEMKASIRALGGEQWIPVGSFGEFVEETRRLRALYELTRNGPSRMVRNDAQIVARLVHALGVAERAMDLYARMVDTVIDVQDMRYVVICVRKDSGLTTDGSWLDVNFPGWRERVDRSLHPGTHYISPAELSTLCDLKVSGMAWDRWTDRFDEISCERCKARYVELFGPDPEDVG